MPLPQWRIASACALGTSHEEKCLPCQDSAAQTLIETDAGIVLAAIVCDGAGSAAFADRGSRLAADSFIGAVEGFLKKGGQIAAITRETASAWIAEVGYVIHEEARQNGNHSGDYACTLLGAIIGEREAAFIQVGDGAIVVSEGPNDGWAWVFWPQHGEYVNITNFITSANVEAAMEFAVVGKPIEELAMFSDGIEHLVLNNATKTVHDAFFDAMFPPVRRASAGLDSKLSADLHSYLMSSRIIEKTDDDKTLILATRRETAPAPENADEPPN